MDPCRSGLESSKIFFTMHGSCRSTMDTGDVMILTNRAHLRAPSHITLYLLGFCLVSQRGTLGGMQGFFKILHNLEHRPLVPLADCQQELSKLFVLIPYILFSL